MAHKSHKKHIKHVRKHEAASSPKAKSPIAKAEAASSRVAKSSRVSIEGGKKPAAKRGVISSLAHKATDKLTARPKKIISKVSARVKSLLG